MSFRFISKNSEINIPATAALVFCIDAGKQTEVFSGLFAALLVAFILTVIAFAAGRRGPWGTSWTFFIVLFLALWLVALFVRQVGPVYYGVSLVPIIIAGVLLALLLAAAIPPANQWRDESIREKNTNTDLQTEASDPRNTGVGRFFWVLILLMIAAIIVGMMNPQQAL